jgi:RNA polymerase sigma factor (sigma-70 family)
MTEDGEDAEEALPEEPEETLESLLTAEEPPRDEAALEEARRGRALLARYLAEIRGAPRLTAEQEQDLARRAQAGDPEAERRLVEANLGLVVRLARRYARRGLLLPDLIAEGNLGLIQAVRRFRPDRGTRFATYATWWVRYAIVRALGNQARLVRLPVHVELLLAQYARARDSLAQELGRPPTLAEVAERLGRPLAQVEDLEALRQQQAVSLDAPVGAGTARLEDTLSDPAAAPEAVAVGTLLRERAELATVLQDLRDNERLVVTLRFGLAGEPPMTLEVIGQRLGVTRERVRQIEGAALARLRRLLAARGVEPSDLA